MEVLSEIEQLTHIHNQAHVIYGGDMNSDMSRNTPPCVSYEAVFIGF